MELNQKFADGQKVTPVDHLMIAGSGKQSFIQFGSIYTVRKYDYYDLDYGWMLELVEVPLPVVVAENALAPIISDDELNEVVNEILGQPVEKDYEGQYY